MHSRAFFRRFQLRKGRSKQFRASLTRLETTTLTAESLMVAPPAFFGELQLVTVFCRVLKVFTCHSLIHFLAKLADPCRAFVFRRSA